MFEHSKDNRANAPAGLPRFTISSIDDNAIELEAQYNPKELQYDRSVSWHAKQSDDMQFAGTEGRSLTVELFFDGFETGESVVPQTDLLEQLATVIEPDSLDVDRQRPHYCLVTWGDPRGVPALRCVIESVQTKYTMFSRVGTPLRATCTVKLKEACVLSKKAKAAKDKNRRAS